MKHLKKAAAVCFALAMIMQLSSCILQEKEEEPFPETPSLELDAGAWNYDSENDVYWQTGVSYCTEPREELYESLGIYIPGAYMIAEDNGDGTYTCKMSMDGRVNDYTAATAPVAISLAADGYEACPAPEKYSYADVKAYTGAGFVYVHPGYRGSSGQGGGAAPWAVADIKAAIRYIRYNGSALPGDEDRIFVLGASGGGGRSALTGASGDGTEYIDYLKAMGAAVYDADGNYISDSVCGVMCLNPVAGLDYADMAYEWNIGQYESGGARAPESWRSALSKDMAREFAAYINELGLEDENGVLLTLEESESGIYAGGTYYDYLLSRIERSLSALLEEKRFPYTPADGSSGTYGTVDDYIAELNSGEEWVVYDEKTKRASVTGIGAFVRNIGDESRGLGAFDALDRGAPENMLFGDGENSRLHFDCVMASMLKLSSGRYAQYPDWRAEYADEYQEYLESVDELGYSSLERQDMYNPMYYLCRYYDGYGTSSPARYWKISSDIRTKDNAMTVPVNLALALSQCEGVKSVEFELPWEKISLDGGLDTGNIRDFIGWVNECCS